MTWNIRIRILDSMGQFRFRFSWMDQLNIIIQNLLSLEELDIWFLKIKDNMALKCLIVSFMIIDSLNIHEICKYYINYIYLIHHFHYSSYIYYITFIQQITNKQLFMNTCSTTDFDKTAQFFFPNSLNPTYSPQKQQQKSLQIICIDPFKKGSNTNIKIKRTNSQIELPKLQLYTEVESPDNHNKIRANFIRDQLYTPNASRAERFPCNNINKSNESSPQKMSSQISFNKQKQTQKSFLKCGPQQKIVTRIFGEL
ncbi:unnamed protein product [Paramecium sonneborni]|uniref:Uncharacterized protein n=1 Tax=Paramecium sonneborni TaxID=65129 RepID=A0A8S1NDY2_9CILI|nr:unnamed protein product [Paramecium sonneborni]